MKPPQSLISLVLVAGYDFVTTAVVAELGTVWNMYVE